MLRFLAWAAVLLAPGLAAQAPESRSQALAAARQVMASAGYCTLITNGDDGRPQARTMDPFAPEAELTVWMATNAASRKVGQIRKDPRVTLHYSDPRNTGAVTILGDAELVADPAEKARRWKPGWSRFYKDENRGPDYLLIRVRPLRLEVVSEPHGLPGDPLTWRAAVVDFR
jgi:general stress protein 26